MAEVVKLDIVINDEIPSEIIAVSKKRRRKNTSRQEPSACNKAASKTEHVKRVKAGSKMEDEHEKQRDYDNIVFEAEETLNVNSYYMQMLCQHQSITPVDLEYKAFMVQDFDLTKSCLLDRYIIVKRRALKTPGGLRVLYGCSCNPARQRMVDTLSVTLSEDLPVDFEAPYQKCHHIVALETIAQDFDKEKEFYGENVLERETNPTEDMYADHSYDKSKQKVELYGLDNNSHVVCVRLKEQNTEPTYTIVSVDFKGKTPTLTCNSCNGKGSCVHTQAILSHDPTESPVVEDILKVLRQKLQWRDRYVPVSVSKDPIPFSVMPEEQKKNRRHLASMLESSEHEFKLIPSGEGSCSCDFAWGDEQETEMVKIYTECDIIPAKVYIRKCQNEKCNNVKEYDGGKEQLLHMGSYLVSHQVLRNYMTQFVTEGTTLAAFYKEWTWKQLNSGNVQFCEEFSYNRFRYAWYSFVKLLEVNYEYGFACPVCGDCPETVVMDGVSLGIRKSFMPWKEYLNYRSTTTTLDGSSHNTRVFINNQNTRRLLQKYVSNETDITEFKLLKLGISQYQPALNQLFINLEGQGYTHSCPDLYRDLLLCLSSNSPVCALVHYHEGLFAIMDGVANGANIGSEISNMILVEQQVPVLSSLLRHFQWSLPAYLRPVIAELLLKAKEPYKINQHHLSMCRDECPCTGTGYFPNLNKQCHRGEYVLDNKKKESQASCSKRFGTHPSLIPGLFTMSCVHGICYGFQVMDDVESPNVPFSILRTRFHTAPKMVIYDNACNLHAYCLNRDPTFFRDTWFVVDRFHWVNHVGCHTGYNLSSYLQFQELNTQVAEQRNATLKKLKSMLSYMNLSNFVSHLKLFMWFRSMISLAVLAPDSPIQNITLFKDLAKVYSKLRS